MVNSQRHEEEEEKYGSRNIKILQQNQANLLQDSNFPTQNSGQRI
jgi:hypothetical protein